MVNSLQSTALAVALTMAGLIGSCTGVVGCSTVQPYGFPAELSMAAKQVAVSITDQGVLEKYTAGLSGQIIEPGVEGYAGVLYIAGGKLRGTSGQIELRGEGAGTGDLTPEARKVILDLAGPDAGQKIIDAIVEASK